MLRNQGPRPRGFTLIELLVLLALLAFLLGFLVSAVQKVRQAANRAQCSNNLKQLALATHNHHDTYTKLPPMVGPLLKDKSVGTTFFYLLPFLEQNVLYQKATEDNVNYSVWIANTQSVPVNVFLCPSDTSRPEGGVYKNWLATSNYAANYLMFGNPAKKTLDGKTRFTDVTDGLSNTIMYAERYQMCNGQPCAWGYAAASYWTPMYGFYSQGKFQSAPKQADCDPALAQGLHSGGIVVGIGDGSVRFLAPTVSPLTWWHATTPNGNDTLGDDW
jgi:prepilin-type N-terminal cleavage/methylation domain-containing protein